MSAQFLLSIDQGTTSSRAIIYTVDGQPVASAQQEFEQHYPHSGWVEHAPGDIWHTVLNTCRQAIEKAAIRPQTIAGIGITNQRETTVLWHRETGQPLYNAIVWQDRRTADLCHQLRDLGNETLLHNKTGLLLDPYFSASKIHWILDTVPGAREAAEQGKVAFGTIDSFLLWRLTGGRVHATDATNASRTALFNIHSQSWDEELLDIFNVPSSTLPDVFDSSCHFGDTDPDLFGVAIPIFGIAGDQQAAAIGQACFEPGMAKSTYGTGCFAIMNTGHDCLVSENRLLSTVAYRLNGETTYALEGSIFNAGTTIQWCRDQLGLIKDAKESEAIAKSLDSNDGVYLVPAFTGLGAPYWDPHARGLLCGITRNTSSDHIVRAALESVCYQTRDLIEAMTRDASSMAIDMAIRLRVDGGMVVNDWFMQFLSNLLHAQVERPVITETTALGAAYLAGLGAGCFNNTDEITERWKWEAIFEPSEQAEHFDDLYSGWNQAVSRTLSQ